MGKQKKRERDNEFADPKEFFQKLVGVANAWPPEEIIDNLVDVINSNERASHHEWQNEVTLIKNKNAFEILRPEMFRE